VPVLNEAQAIKDCLDALAPARRQGASIIVADGGSSDETAARARALCDALITAPRGRGSQMNAGAAAASNDILLFLHADTRLPQGGLEAMLENMARTGHNWGRFDVEIEGNHFLLPIVAALMNLRSRLTGIATGDQAIFVRRDIFETTGGFPDIALMEDIAMSKRLKRFGRPLCLRERVSTSGRRWEKHGVLRTIWTMWRLRAAYFFGADPAGLARRYGYRPRGDQA